MAEGSRAPRFHGRVEGDRACGHPGCDRPGEFRAPGERRGTADGPAPWRWLCLDHVRAFNAGYNFFNGMSADEIADAQRPYAGWERETRAFSAAGADRPPRWTDFHDPLDAIQARFRRETVVERRDGRPLSAEDRRALKTLGLEVDADRRALRTLGLEVDADRRALRERYSELVRRYHPDRNGGDRSHEAQLAEAIAAYQRLRKAPAFA